MKRLLIALIASSVIGATAQSPMGSGVSPKDIVEQFVKWMRKGSASRPKDGIKLMLSLLSQASHHTQRLSWSSLVDFKRHCQGIA
jgi:hypothetical protein